jgi:hypothetical protein
LPRTLAAFPIKAAFREIEALVRDGDSLQAMELKIEVANGIWERSRAPEVARDAFLRRIRGKDFNPIRYLDPLTSDRGAALARIMQAISKRWRRW